MARDFTANTSNYLSLGANALGPLLNGAASISVHLIAFYDTLAGTSVGHDLFSVAINGATTGLAINSIDPAGGVVHSIRAGGRSVSGDTFRTLDGTTAIAASTTYAVGVAFQISADNIVIYLNGTQDASGISGTWGNASYTNGTPTTHDGIGAAFSGSTPISTTRQFDGRLAEVAVWAGDIGAAGFAQVGQRISPLLVRPDLLVAYWPLIGRYSPETDLVSGIAGTITGTVAQADHPRVISARGPQIVARPAASVAPSSRYNHFTLLGVS